MNIDFSSKYPILDECLCFCKWPNTQSTMNYIKCSIQSPFKFIKELSLVQILNKLKFELKFKRISVQLQRDKLCRHHCYHMLANRKGPLKMVVSSW